MRFPCLQQVPQGIELSLQIQPRSSRNQIVGLQGERLKVKLTAPPIEGAANKCCCEYFAKLLHIAKSQVELLSGDKSRQKKILLREVDLQQVVTLLENIL